MLLASWSFVLSLETCYHTITWKGQPNIWWPASGMITHKVIKSKTARHCLQCTWPWEYLMTQLFHCQITCAKYNQCWVMCTLRCTAQIKLTLTQHFPLTNIYNTGPFSQTLFCTSCQEICDECAKSLLLWDRFNHCRNDHQLTLTYCKGILKFLVINSMLTRTQ